MQLSIVSSLCEEETRRLKRRNAQACAIWKSYSGADRDQGADLAVLIAYRAGGARFKFSEDITSVPWVF